VFEHLTACQDHHRRTGQGELDDHRVIGLAVIIDGVDPAVRQERDVELRGVDPAACEPEAGADLALGHRRVSVSVAAFAPA
jgi:hypothetical protein